jgi:hypothetical protein
MPNCIDKSPYRKAYRGFANQMLHGREIYCPALPQFLSYKQPKSVIASGANVIARSGIPRSAGKQSRLPRPDGLAMTNARPA